MMKIMKVTTTNTLGSRKAFTLIEILIALAIFGILIAIASGAIVQYLRVQSDQEAVTSAQARLRRVTELVSQEMRSAVFGSILPNNGSNYDADTDSISFLLLDGGAGYPVLGTAATFSTAASLNISSSAIDNAALGIATGDELLMLNPGSGALLFRAGAMVKNVADWSITHVGTCKNTIPYTPNTLLFKVRTFAVRHDLASKTLFAREGGVEQTLAWNITNFRIDYVYQNVAGSTEINPVSFPTKKIGGLTLQRLQIVAGTGELSRGKTIERTYSSQIELADNNTVNIGGLTVCP
jgi:prepilin-type N-terminal cleavage/methylation domain-containing protein